ncbi:ABC transporter permease [Lacrimispora sphenoides]|uniref:Ribose transport system permease protein n=1 Tax=Lacrimispora sphenoides JCM 1415 TaxID=1297793 RepID=A0ABY1CDT4_9FIRM|nr:ABC transporter permease [Lacrimispora sphenoides]SET95896.1 ribose transport system permease protein [[Clostridium] sphenoides JCM 1415]SUY52729.1 ribose ABC transporter permease [Lacrimispora sphenoides]
MKNKMGVLKKMNFREYGVVIGFILLCVVISFATPAFATQKNILNLLRQSSIIGIIATGMTFVIISGSFDISVGAVAALSGAITMKLITMGNGVPVAIAVLAALGIGAVVGLINGIAVAKINVPSLIATMAMVSVVKGSMLMFTGGYPITRTIPVLDTIGNGYVAGIPIPVIIFAATVAIAFIILTKTRFGRYVYSVGGNEEASKLNGINVDSYKIKVFVINAVLAALAGIVLVGRMGTASPAAGDGYDMDAIASVVIGGTSVAGGSGSVLKTVIGVLLMSVINNSFNLLGVDMYFQYIFKGLIILIAVGADSFSKKRLASS